MKKQGKTTTKIEQFAVNTILLLIKIIFNLSFHLINILIATILLSITLINNDLIWIMIAISWLALALIQGTTVLYMRHLMIEEYHSNTKKEENHANS